MRLFDLHCDTIFLMEQTGKALRQNDLHISLEKAGIFERWAQLFAIFIPDEYRGDEAIAFFHRHYARLMAEFEKNSDLIRFCPRPRSETPADGLMMAMLGVEGGCVLAGDLSRVSLLSDLGVRLITLVWNGDNEIASGVLGSGGGLTPFGREAVLEMLRHDITPDVSHLNDRGFFELCELTDRPFIASHSNARAVCSHPRNLTDEQFGVIRERGGLVGLNLCCTFLRNGVAHGDTDVSLDDILRHLDHFWSLGGEDILCMGSDFDGAPVPNALPSIDRMPVLYDKLLQSGYSEALLHKFFFQNAWRFFTQA